MFPMTFIKGMIWGLASASLFLPLLLLFASMQGWIILTIPNVDLLDAWHWLDTNLGMSLFFFIGLSLLWLHLFNKVSAQLGAKAPAEVVFHSIQKLDLTMNLFIAVGVVFTAIGLRECLISTLGDVDASSANQHSAFEMMAALINNGLLVALTSTILGAVGGYILKAAKSWLLGDKINAYMSDMAAQKVIEESDFRQQVTLLLGNIEKRLENSGDSYE